MIQTSFHIIVVRNTDQKWYIITIIAEKVNKFYLFWATPTFLCQRLHCLVGANILPPRHMLPKAAWPDLGIGFEKKENRKKLRIRYGVKGSGL